MKYIKWFFRVLWENLIYRKKYHQCNLTVDKDKLTVMTFNIRRDVIDDGEYNWQYRRDSIIQMINEYNPDIICMQEVMPHMAKYLIQELSACYDHNSIDCSTNMKLTTSFLINGEGMLTLFKKDRFKLIKSHYMVLYDKRPINTRRALISALKCEIGDITIINTHFCYLDSNCRKQSFEKISNWINDNHITNVFIAGDFNTELHCVNDGIDIFTKQFSCNERDAIGSLNSFGKISGCTIDYIFSDKQIINSEVIRKEYDIKYLSDHYPIINTYHI